MPNADQVFVLTIVVIVAVTAVISIVARSWLAARRDTAARMLREAPSDDRLARLEQAVDAIAIEVERMSEGQRFVAKLLAERKEADLVRRPPERVKTPT